MRYTVKKLTAFLFTMVVVSLLTFIAFDLISGDPAQAMLGTEATPEKLAALREQLGLNQPLLVRYGQWLAGFFTGNLGTSYNYNLPVGQLIAPKLGLTLCLSFLAFALTFHITLIVAFLGCLLVNSCHFRFGSLFGLFYNTLCLCPCITD